MEKAQFLPLASHKHLLTCGFTLIKSFKSIFMYLTTKKEASECEMENIKSTWA